jgi:hypothetical protein
MDLTLARTSLASAQALIDAAVAAIADPPPDQTIVVKSGDSLQAALDSGKPVVLDGTVEGSFMLRTGNRVTVRPGSAIRGVGGSALIVLPGTTDVSVVTSDPTGFFDCTAPASADAVVQLGENTDRQIRIEDVPARLTFDGLRVPAHRGKRAFAIHAADVVLTRARVFDVWSQVGQESQAIHWGNTPGGLVIDDFIAQAGSQAFLAGGDTTRIPHLTPGRLTLTHFTLGRPLAWKSDGVYRKVKNIFELKNATDVVLRNGVLDGCWAEGQMGEAFMLTPALDGALTTPPKQSGNVQRVLVEDVTVQNCSTLVNVLGRHYTSYTPDATGGIVFRRVKATLDRTLFGGRGQVLTSSGEPADLRFEACDFTSNGTSTLYYENGTVLDPTTLVKRVGGKFGSLALVGNRITVSPTYGFMFCGNSQASKLATALGAWEMSGNTFVGGTSGFAANINAQNPNTPNAFVAG